MCTASTAFGQADHGIGAYHGAEIPYVFDTHDGWLPTDAIDHDLTRRMMGYWLNFATTGDPNHDDAPGVAALERRRPNAVVGRENPGRGVRRAVVFLAGPVGSRLSGTGQRRQTARSSPSGPSPHRPRTPRLATALRAVLRRRLLGPSLRSSRHLASGLTGAYTAIPPGASQGGEPS